MIDPLVTSLDRQLTLQIIFGSLIALQKFLSLSIFNNNLLSFYERVLDVIVAHKITAFSNVHAHDAKLLLLFLTWLRSQDRIDPPKSLTTLRASP